MQKRRKITKLGRDKAHREALLRNLSQDLIRYGKIRTTLPKAKALRPFVEPLITKARSGSDHARNLVSKVLYDKTVVEKLFADVAPKFVARNGGYTRIVKLGNRQGDGVEEAMIMLVESEETKADKPKAKKGRSK